MITWYRVADSNELTHSETPNYVSPVMIDNDEVKIYISNSVNMGGILQTTAIANFRGLSLEVPISETLVVHRDKSIAMVREGTEIYLGVNNA